MNLAEEKYGIAKPILPTCLHFKSKQLRDNLLHFVDTHTRFVLEVPAFRGKIEINLPDIFVSRYTTAPCSNESKLDLSCLTQNIAVISDEATLIFNRIHEVLLVYKQQSLECS